MKNKLGEYLRVSSVDLKFSMGVKVCHHGGGGYLLQAHLHLLLGVNVCHQKGRTSEIWKQINGVRSLLAPHLLVVVEDGDDVGLVVELDVLQNWSGSSLKVKTTRCYKQAQWKSNYQDNCRQQRFEFIKNSSSG